MKPLISVIIPVYNAANTIDATLVSVLNQTWPNIEIICVNDGSCDASIEILNRYADRVKIVSQENKGQCAASNVGLSYATGDYIKFFDADDIMNPEHLELQMKKLDGRVDAVASCEWGRFYDDNPESAIFNPESVWRDMNAFEWLKASLLQKNDMMGAWVWLIPRAIIQKSGGWDERLSLNNDFEFSVRLLMHTQDIVFASGAKVYYRSGQVGNLAGQTSEKAYKAALLSTDLGCDLLLKHDPSSQMRLICANRYQEWVFRMYPSYLPLVAEAERKIAHLGGSSRKMEGGKAFTLLRSFFGWKIAKRIQIFFYKSGYTPSNKIRK